MIFVTVGTDVPFDRLVRVVDEWADRRERSDVFAQIGSTEWKPARLAYTRFLAPDEFMRRFAEARLVVAHAGMGTILSALRCEKPILVMPRHAALGETRNDHQLATARHLSTLGRINVAMDDAELRSQLDRIDELKAREPIGPYASPELIDTIRRFIVNGHAPASGHPLGRSAGPR